MSDDRRSVYYEGETLVLRASSLGYCIKGLVAHKLGLDPLPHPQSLLRAFAAGHENEIPILKKALEDLGIPYTPGEQDEVELKVRKGLVIRGHLDYLDEDVFEVKLLAGDQYKKYLKASDRVALLPVYYKWQISVYMHATGKEAFYVIGEKDKNNEWTGKYLSFRIENPPIPKADIIARALFIKNAEELPACDFSQFPCQFSYLHTEQDDKGIKEYAEVDDGDVFDVLVAKLTEAREQEKYWEQERKAASQGIKGLCDAAGSNRIKHGKVKVVWVRQTNRVIDWGKVPDEVKEVIEECKIDGGVREYPRVYGLKGEEDE